MDTRHLINGIVQQTTVLIAQLSTVAGIRAPLSRLADQVFLQLAHELEAQGVGRKVAADMFGLALRSYQLKISRLTASASASEKTLWEAVIDHLKETSGATRKQLVERFRTDDPADIAAVLRDLVEGSLVSRTGKGDHAFYQLASNEAVAAAAALETFDTTANLVWLAIYDRQEVRRAALPGQLSFEPTLTERCVELLLADGRVELVRRGADEWLACRQLTIPVGARQGWEAAVFDHFRAVSTAIAAKLQRTGPRSQHGDLVGGTTLTFSLRRGHPYEQEAYGLLERMRSELNELWSRVVEHNKANPIDPAERAELTFYFGQMVVEPGGTESPPKAPPSSRSRDSLP